MYKYYKYLFFKRSLNFLGTRDPYYFFFFMSRVTEEIGLLPITVSKDSSIGSLFVEGLVPARNCS